MNRLISCVACLAVAACGALVTNTDKPVGPYVSSEPIVETTVSAKVSANPPSNGGVSVSGISCKNRLWDAAPTNEAAVLVLRREAQKAGFNSVFVQEVQPDEAALAKNCWSAIVARGIAFNS
jgi:hypothetical protein